MPSVIGQRRNPPAVSQCGRGGREQCGGKQKWKLRMNSPLFAAQAIKQSAAQSSFRQTAEEASIGGYPASLTIAAIADTT